jgi:hydroxypyruvate isomerase
MAPLKFAANLSWLYTDLPFLDRFEAAAADGFQGVECLFPHEHPTAELAARLRAELPTHPCDGGAVP